MKIVELKHKHLGGIFYTSKQQFKDESWSLKQFFESMKNKNYIFLGVVQGEQICSYIVALKSLDDVNILSVATKDKFKRKGCAKALVSKLIELCKKHKKTLSLEVKEDNICAINLYLSLGFKVEHKREKYYKDGKTALIMFLR